MNIVGIGACQSVAFRSRTIKPEVIEKRAQSVVEAAKAELAAIEKQGKVAGTDAAWWRGEFGEAKKALENIVKNGELNQPENKKHGSSLINFHDYDNDGLI